MHEGNSRRLCFMGCMKLLMDMARSNVVARSLGFRV